MKALLVVLALSLSITAFAQEDAADSASDGADQTLTHNTQMIGYGTGYGMCDGNGMGWYCMDQVKKQAHENAIADAGRQCSMQNGSIDTYSAICNDLCNPFDLPPGSPMQNVSCSSNCSVSCTLPN